MQVPNLRAASITFTETLKEGWSGSLMAISTWASFTAQNFVFLKSNRKTASRNPHCGVVFPTSKLTEVF